MQNNAKNWKKGAGGSQTKNNPDLSSLVYGKIPPQAPELEEAVLGAILLERDVYDTVSSILKPEAFYNPANQNIFAACCLLSTKGSPIDLLTVTEEMRKSGVLEIAGGAYYLTKLTMSVVSGAHVEAHARIILEKHIQRQLIRIAGNTISAAYEDATDVIDLLDHTGAELFGLTAGNLNKSYKSSKDLAYEAIQKAHRLQENRGEISGVTTGYRSLDSVTGGWEKGRLIIVAARPSVGKTAFVLNLALNAVQSSKKTGIGFFSLEMSSEELTDRALSVLSQINLRKITRGNLEPWEMEALEKAAMHFASLNMHIDDQAAISIHELRAKARRMVTKQGVGLIIIDYLQLMKGIEDNNVRNREQEISKISRDIKALAKELEVPVIALSQMSRAVESRKESNAPQLSDLRESGAIEQDADVVMFLTRMGYQQTDQNIDPAIKDDAQLWIKKNRNGTLQDVAFKTVLSIQTWFDLEDYDSFMAKKNAPAFPNAGIRTDNYRDFTEPFPNPYATKDLEDPTF